MTKASPAVTETTVLLGTEDGDLGLVPADKAHDEAVKAANEEGKTVTIRNPVTDAVIETINPTGADDDLSIPAILDRTKGKTREELDAERDALIAAAKKKDEAQRKLIGKTTTAPAVAKAKPPAKAKPVADPEAKAAHAKLVAQEAKKQAADHATPKAAKANGKKAAPKQQAKVKTAPKTATKAPKVVKAKKEGPTGMVAEILKLASRASGASRPELIKLTGWKQQAWKWGFHNSKKNGWCQKWGYTLKIIEGKDGETRYHVTKK